jgi:hypothetical protein
VDAVAGEPFELTVETADPTELVVPPGWTCKQLDDQRFLVVADVVAPVRRARIAAAVTRDGRYLGQQAEALVDVRLP